MTGQIQNISMIAPHSWQIESSFTNVPLVIGLNGETILLFVRKSLSKILGFVDSDIDFTKDLNTEVLGSCTASFEDQMYVFGGQNLLRQVNIDYLNI